MGKLLTGRYGHAPEAESSVPISLTDCNQKLGLKPSDFVSQGMPDFFQKSYGTHDRYLVFQLDAAEVAGNPVWQPGYYLLPLEAMDVLKVFEKNKLGVAGQAGLPIHLEIKKPPPEPVLERAQRWAEQSQPLFFKCGCPHLELHLDAPWALRKRWRARLRCPKRCQPVLSTLL